MSDTMDPLQRWQRDVAAKLESEVYYADIPIFVVRPREKETTTAIQTQIDQALSGIARKDGKAGASVMVMMPQCDVPARDPAGPHFSSSMIIRVQEFPIINEGSNGTHKPCEEIALQTMHVLHRWIPGNYFQQQGFAKEAYTPSLEFDPKITVDLLLNARFGLSGPARVQIPIIAGNAGAVQLSCITPGANIYYTTDFSFPGPDKIPYAAPFAVQAGTTVRAAAYKPATHQGSDVAVQPFAS